ncbi:hypothetical protein QE152_g7251 [Popillia japonica]|uniref:Uncharacterized protein n=1 Tax=Popillia japonica TaxID=7064 RepID=A0AAW1MEI1_POPJA
MSTEDKFTADYNIPLSLLAELWKVPPALVIEECNDDAFLSFDENLVIAYTNDMPSVILCHTAVFSKFPNYSLNRTPLMSGEIGTGIPTGIVR